MSMVVRKIVGWIIEVTIADCRWLILEITLTMVPQDDRLRKTSGAGGDDSAPRLASHRVEKG